MSAPDWTEGVDEDTAEKGKGVGVEGTTVCREGMEPHLAPAASPFTCDLNNINLSDKRGYTFIQGFLEIKYPASNERWIEISIQLNDICIVLPVPSL